MGIRIPFGRADRLISANQYIRRVIPSAEHPKMRSSQEVYQTVLCGRQVPGTRIVRPNNLSRIREDSHSGTSQLQSPLLTYFPVNTSLAYQRPQPRGNYVRYQLRLTSCRPVAYFGERVPIYSRMLPGPAEVLMRQTLSLDWHAAQQQ